MTSAAQQPPVPAREPHKGQVAVSTSPTEPVPEVRVAANEGTYLHFDAAIDRASVEVEGRVSRFLWVEVGDKLIGLEPSVDLGADEKLVVRVRYKDAASPTTATLVLVTRPAVVDREVTVVRQARTREALEEKLAETESALAALNTQCNEGGLLQLAFSGMLDADIKAIGFLGTMVGGYAGGLEPGRGVGFRDSSWAMVVLRVRNLPGHAPWTLSTARLTSLAGTSVRVRFVHMERPLIEAGGGALIAVMVEPPSKSERYFVLELVDVSGGLHPVNIKL